MGGMEEIRKIGINYITNIMMVEFDVNLIAKQELTKIIRNPICKFFKLGPKFYVSICNL